MAKRIPTDQEIIDAVRSDRTIGRGTCSSVDECYDNSELVAEFHEYGKSLRQFILFLKKIEKIRQERINDTY